MIECLLSLLLFVRMETTTSPSLPSTWNTLTTLCRAVRLSVTLPNHSSGWAAKFCSARNATTIKPWKSNSWLHSHQGRRWVFIRDCHHWRMFVQGIPIHVSAIPALFIPCCSLTSWRESSFSVCCGMMLQQSSEALCGTPVQRSSLISVANLPNSTSKLECSRVLDEHWKLKLKPKTFLWSSYNSSTSHGWVYGIWEAQQPTIEALIDFVFLRPWLCCSAFTSEVGEESSAATWFPWLGICA